MNETAEKIFAQDIHANLPNLKLTLKFFQKILNIF